SLTSRWLSAIVRKVSGPVSAGSGVFAVSRCATYRRGPGAAGPHHGGNGSAALVAHATGPPAAPRRARRDFTRDTPDPRPPPPRTARDAHLDLAHQGHRRGARGPRQRRVLLARLQPEPLPERLGDRRHDGHAAHQQDVIEALDALVPRGGDRPLGDVHRALE